MSRENASCHIRRCKLDKALELEYVGAVRRAGEEATCRARTSGSFQRGRRVRLLSGHTPRRRKGSGDRDRFRGARRERGLRAIADEFARTAFSRPAPDLFWRSIPGRSRATTMAPSGARSRALKNQDGRSRPCRYARQSAQLPQSNGRAAVIGFCTAVPMPSSARSAWATSGYLLPRLADARLHGELEGLARPVCIIWATRTTRRPPRCSPPIAARRAHEESGAAHIPGVQHGT